MDRSIVIEAKWDYQEYIDQGKTVYDEEEGKDVPDADYNFLRDLENYLNERFEKLEEKEYSKEDPEVVREENAIKVDMVETFYKGEKTSVTVKHKSYIDDWPPLEVPDREKVRIEISSDDIDEANNIAEEIKSLLPWAYEISDN